MPAQLLTSVENNFTKGLITESTGLNFPENAATSTDNCIYTLVGDVTRRLGFDYEDNFIYQNFPNTGVANATYKWNNAGGDGSTQMVVTQLGVSIFFYVSSNTTGTVSLSSQILAQSVTLSNFKADIDPTLECQFADGNGYLFIFHPQLDPLYVSYVNGQIAVNGIVIQVRDFAGAIDGLTNQQRPGVLSTEHQYNLQNQGWTSGNSWAASSTDSKSPPNGNNSWNIGVVAGITTGQLVSIRGTSGFAPAYYNGSGTVIAYAGGIITINVFGGSGDAPAGFQFNQWSIVPTNTGYINTWVGAEANYPSNSDVWWYFKDTSNVFNPAVTQPQVTLSSGAAPRGHYLLNTFNQDRSSVSSVPNINIVATTNRPSTGAWFQGRLWASGVNANAAQTNNTNFYTWSEDIYFSQVVITSADFGSCYQTNDPTSENLFDLLPTDGGVIKIPGSGAIYKLFPIQNGLLVFAANGVWFITGSQGIGFAANDYTIVKLSEVKSIASTSIVNVLGLPYFWNEEGIYMVSPSQGGALQVEPITVGTILSFYNEIPIQSRRFARGAYDPVNYVIQWLYRTTPETGISNRYQFDSLLNFNTYNKAFFPYTFPSTNPVLTSIVYVSSPGGTNAPDPTFKYYTQTADNKFTWSEENDGSYTDFVSFDGVGTDFKSFFVTGYKLRGQAIRKFQVQYVNMFSRMNNAENAYNFQTLWDFSNTRDSNRWSSIQQIFNIDTRYDTMPRRHKVRGRGYAVQLKVSSVSGQPFDIQGWAIVDLAEQGT